MKNLPTSPEFQKRPGTSAPKLWTAWVLYTATGEGATMIARIAYAADEAQARSDLAKAFGPYFAALAEISEGVERNHITETLFGEAALKIVESHRGTLELKAQLHCNH